MFNATKQTLEQLKEVLQILPHDCYSNSCKTLSGATIGQHTRHIIELYQCLFVGYDTGLVCYDKRQRNRKIETEVHFALEELQNIQVTISKRDKVLLIEYDINGNLERLKSNYHREVMYNLEHTIHHKALIKVGINELTQMILPSSFGVAPSTLQFRKLCVR